MTVSPVDQRAFQADNAAGRALRPSKTREQGPAGSALGAMLITHAAIIENAARAPARAGAWAWATLWTVLAAVAVIASERFADVAVMRAANHHALDALRDTFETISQLGRLSWHLAALGVAIPLALAFRARRLCQWLTLVLLSALATGAAVQIAKAIAGRHRPKALLDDGLYGFSWFDFGYGTASFPSGHTATIAALVAALWIVTPRCRDLLLLPVLAVAGSRLLSGSHYLSDVLAGAYVGAMTTFILYRVMVWAGMPEFAGRSRPITTSVSQSPLE